MKNRKLTKVQRKILRSLPWGETKDVERLHHDTGISYKTLIGNLLVLQLPQYDKVHRVSEHRYQRWSSAKTKAVRRQFAATYGNPRRGRHARRGRARNPRRPSLRSAVYTRKQRVRGWTIPISVTWDPTAGGKMLRQRLAGWTKADHLKAAADAMRKAKAMNARWNKVADQAARATWGRGYQIGDYQVSGIASNEFSASFKDKLRKLAQDASTLKSVAYAHQKAAGKQKVGINSRKRR